MPIQSGERSKLTVVVSGLALGFFAGRVLAETLSPSLPPWASLAVTTILAVCGLFLAQLLHRHTVDPSPLLLLLVYILWPRPQPAIAVSVAFLAVATQVLTLRVLRQEKSTATYPFVSDAVLFLVSLVRYVSTLAPTVLPADSGEFQFVSYVLGIAHPPGYPLYTLLAKLFTLLPFGDVAYRVNLFAAVTSALTLVVVSRAVRRATGSGVAGWIAALGLGLAPTFWAQSTTANIRSLTALFTALQLYALLCYDQSRETKHLVAFAVALGLGITHHSSLLPLVLPYLAFLLFSHPELLRQPRSWLKPLVGFALSLLVLLYLPLRSWLGAPFDPQPIRNLSDFLEHVLALGFRGDMFYFVQPSVLMLRLRVLWNILTFEFGTLWLLLPAWGALSLLWRRRRWLLLAGGIFAVNALLAVTYRAPQTVEYLIPAYVALAFLAGYGAWSLYTGLRFRAAFFAPLAAMILAISLLLPVWRSQRNYSSFLQLSQDRSTRQYAEEILTQAPQGARILANWHFATPLWYLQYVEAQRPDVEVAYVYPEGAEPIFQTWVRRVEQSSQQRPTIVTNRYLEFESLPYTFRPLAGAWLVQTAPVYELPDQVQNLSALFDQRIQFVGYELNYDRVSPSDNLTVRLYWQPSVKLERDYSFFVHLVDQTGAPLGQGDMTHQAMRYEVGEVILDEYRIPLLPAVRPGRYKLIAGVYITLPEGGWRRLTTEDGHDSTVLSEVEVKPLDSAPVTRHVLYHSFANGCTLVGVDYDRSVPGQLRLYLHWQAHGPAPDPQKVMLFSAGVPQLVADLPTVLAGKYFTTVHDLSAEASALSVEVQDAASETPSRRLGPWGIPLWRRLSLPQPAADERYLPLGGEVVLVKAAYPAVAQAGLSLPARMTWVGRRAITHDYTVSVSLVGESGTWHAQHDGTPALGAIPTLKWIRGITVADEHSLILPEDAAGRGTLWLTVYDAFTMQPLPVLDERLARLGQGTQVALGEVALR